MNDAKIIGGAIGIILLLIGIGIICPPLLVIIVMVAIYKLT